MKTQAQFPSYRIRLLHDVWRILVLPTISCYAFLRLADVPLGWLSPLCYSCFLVAWGYAKGIYYDRIHASRAAEMNARMVPRAKGRLPGNVDVLFKMMKAFRTSYVLDVYRELFEEHQSSVLNLRILWKDQIITMDEAHAKFVLSTGFEHFWRGRAQKERMETFLGQGIFNRDDDMWKMHRSFTRPFFARERISDFDTFERHTSRALAILSTHSFSTHPIEVQDLFARFSLDAASSFLFGATLDTLSHPLPLPSSTSSPTTASATPLPTTQSDATASAFRTFTAGFESAQRIATTRARLGHYFWPLAELFEDKSLAAQRDIRRWLDPLVERALAERCVVEGEEKAGEEEEERKTFLQHLVDSTEDKTLIRDQLLNVLLASRDTTACLLTFTTYLLALHPDVMVRLRTEVLDRCGSSRTPTWDDVRAMKYLRAVLNETLRLFPPVPLNVRESRAAPCTLPRPAHPYTGDTGAPYYMPPETVIMYFPLLIQRDPVLWGPDADAFDPDRWIDPARLAKFTGNPMMFTPFSAGPRICLGQNYALNEVSFFLVRLLQRFDGVSLAPDAQPAESRPPAEWKARPGRQAHERVWPAAAITLFVKGGLWVRFHQAP
ncbi:cytochrome P450 monooxygenase CYP63 [Punctularia strigosozonata HHB-11173 SS5]|uniref:Cytochrome P450 monooxygenase CYP63 n=1 Tax=Punctularia strigosozonata (strain HHB-11173) TaxID=741275 RepID=R7S4D4_PUNST|nr:cytochrome P450 monooxygenase CYP63 [Punctularia strigosozonata HHB-11173 SS5]EIN04106.1 cytochrome P450 monooxygenase CYP63 [Punctularia strigosozonata HHB-11173 SS5]